MKYLYHDFNSSQFEDLTIAICHMLLGVGIQGFADGVDGGRDARFEAQAERYPSSIQPWQGITIIQAKHTNSPIGKFSDNDFFGNQSSIINKEITKITKMVQNQELDNYLLVSNRKNTAIYNEKIKAHLSSETGLPKANIGVIGIEDLERIIKAYPEIERIAEIKPFEGPLIIDPDSLANVIEAITSNKNQFSKTIDNLSQLDDIIRTGFNDKNTINGLSKEYADCIEPYIKDFKGIEEFLNEPDNDHYLQFYEDACEELKFGIVAHGDDFDNFDKVLDYTIKMLINRDSTLKSEKKLTRTMVYYMYFHCDIGRNK